MARRNAYDHELAQYHSCCVAVQKVDGFRMFEYQMSISAGRCSPEDCERQMSLPMMW
jgi:hypothetical protein